MPDSRRCNPSMRALTGGPDPGLPGLSVIIGSTVSKNYREMTAAERTAARIAQNREIEQRLTQEPAILTLGWIVDRLRARKQRASYGAVADLLEVLPRGLMTGLAKCHRYSWVVAGAGPHAGWPTDYAESEIDPDCLRQILSGESDMINDAESLRAWLRQ
jgi:hypothetical protein